MSRPFLLINRSVIVNGTAERVLVHEQNGIEIYRITNDRILECVEDFVHQNLGWDLERHTPGGGKIRTVWNVGSEHNWSMYFIARIERDDDQLYEWTSTMDERYDILEDPDDEEYVAMIKNLTSFYRILDLYKERDGTVVTRFSLGFLVDDPHADESTEEYSITKVNP